MTKKQVELAKKKTEEWSEKVNQLSLTKRELSKRRKHKKKPTKKSKVKFQNKPTVKIYKDYKEYLQSKEWKTKRLKVLERANYICEICKTKKAYQVHHKTYKRIYKEKLSDLIATCGICHQAEHNLLSERQVEKAVDYLFGMYLK